MADGLHSYRRKVRPESQAGRGTRRRVLTARSGGFTVELAGTPDTRPWSIRECAQRKAGLL